MSTKRKADRHDGPIETHPEVGDGKPYKLLKNELVLIGNNKRRVVTLERAADKHKFTMRCDDFCLQGSRPPDNLVYQLDVIRNGEFTLVNEEDGQLGQGSRTYITLIRQRDQHKFTMCCNNFCRKAQRPPGKLVYQLEAIVSGEFTLVNEEDGQLGQGSGQNITLIRTRDKHEFTMRCDTFCLRGARPPDKLVYQLEAIVSGEFTLVNEEDGQLGQGSAQNITLIRTRDEHEFTMRCDAFCAGHRPPDKLVYQLDAIVSGEFTLVNAEDGQLGQGTSTKHITLIRTGDEHEFTMRCDVFCLQGSRPPEKLMYQLDVIRNGEFTLVNKEDGQLSQGSDQKITLIRVHDQLIFTECPHQFCRRICFHCLEMSHCTYAPNTCASCWCIQYPGAALAVTPKEGNKTEILVAAMLEAHLGRVRKEYPTRDDKREDVVLMATMLCAAIDGIHHFFDHDYGNGLILCALVQLVDTAKCRWWLEDHPGKSYVRMLQRTTWRGYPVNQRKPISFDFVNAVNYVDKHPELYGGKVVFLEKAHLPTLYGEHRRLLDVEGIAHVTLDPSTIAYGPCRITEDKRAMLSQ